jgi:hypothetical protein
MKDEKLLSRFMRNTAHHNVIIERDEGVYRHLIFKAPGTNSYRFDIITWPGYLTVTGDMGTWTFSRERDMITQFFPVGTAGASTPATGLRNLKLVLVAAVTNHLVMSSMRRRSTKACRSGWPAIWITVLMKMMLLRRKRLSANSLAVTSPVKQRHLRAQ